MIFILRTVPLVWLASLLVGTGARAQGLNGPAVPDSSGPWHAATELSDPLEAGMLGPDDVLRAAQSEIALGRPDRALAILNDHPLPDSTRGGAPLSIFADALMAKGEYADAARLFAEAAEHTSGMRRSVLFAQAAAGYERAEMWQSAGRLWAEVATAFPDAEGWTALRRGRIVPDTAVAMGLLASAPRAARVLAAEWSADRRKDAGNLAGAVADLESIERYGRAAQLALQRGDLAVARRLADRGLRSRDSAEAMSSVAVVREAFPPSSPAEHLAMGRAIFRHGDAEVARTAIQAAVTAGDSSAQTLLLLGQVTAAAGERRAALRHYAAAAATDEPEAVEAEFRRARLNQVLRNTRTAAAQYTRFINDQPDHRRTPTAVFLLGAIHQDAGRTREADSLFSLLNGGWPDNRDASDARFRLIRRALRRGDTTTAVELYRTEIDTRGSRARRFRFELARLWESRGDTSRARQEWATLARIDSVGYYGTIAREAIDMPPARFEPEPVMPADPEVARQLQVLDLLTASGLYDEADALVADLSNPDHYELEQLIQVAQGLIARGRTLRAIRLGWRLAGLHTLNDPRIVRVIFPYPRREMVEREAAKFDIDPWLVAAMIRQESAFDIDATSRAGARGLMQLMPATASGLARRLQVDWNRSYLGVPDANLHLGVAHLAALYRRYEGELIRTLAAYNAGGSRVARWVRYPEARDPFLFVERIPFAETRGYIQAVLRNKTLYQALYGDHLIP